MQQGTAARFGILKQAAKGTPQTSDPSFHYLAFLGCDYAANDGTRQLEPEAGQQKALPRGTYKTGVVAQGGVDFIPRLENRFGYWLEAVFGDVSTYGSQATVAQWIAGAGTTANVYSHMFRFDSSDEFSIPYLTVHKYWPNDTASDSVGEVSQDARVTAFTLNAVAADVARARVDLFGVMSGDPVWDFEPSWTEPTLDDDDTYAVTACAGSVKLSINEGDPSDLTEFDVTSVRLTVANNLLPANRSRKIGSAHPVDYPVLSRTITLETVILIDDYKLAVQALGGPANPAADSAWSCSICQGDFDVQLESRANITGSTPYLLRFRTYQQNVDWSVRPIVFMPNEPVVLALVGNVRNVSSGRPFEFYVQNSHSSYA